MYRYLLILLLGTIIIYIGVGKFTTDIGVLNGGVYAEATVVEFRETTDSDGQKTYSPVFKYSDYRNKDITYNSELITAGSWRIGDKVKILYQKNFPGGTVLLTYRNMFGELIIFLMLGSILLLISGGYFVAQFFFKSLPLSNT